MSTPGADGRYRYFVAIYRCDVVTSGPFTFVSAETKVELFRDKRTYFPGEYGHGVFATVVDAVYCFPAPTPIFLTDECQHLVISTRSRQSRTEAQSSCEEAIDRVVSLLSALLSTDLFRTLLFRGWLRGGPPDRNLGLLIKAVSPTEVKVKELALELSAVRRVVAVHPDARERFSLMARFIARGVAEPPGEEAFVWLWTALEIFPMVNTTNIRPISAFLAPYLGLDPTAANERLRIGWLFGLRSKLVHDGKLPMSRDDQFSALSRLELLVRAVVRHIAGLKYDGTLDHFLR